MPPVIIDSALLSVWGNTWLGTIDSKGASKDPNRFDRKQSMDFGKEIIDYAVATSLAKMLGNIPIESPIGRTSLLPPKPNCVEVGDTRIIGGVRAQNFDLAYRPDGVRIAYDSKTLNERESIGKNWQNMINDLATESTTVHTRFPYALVAFVIVIPKSILEKSQELDIIRTLERLGNRRGVQEQSHLAEVISFIVWDPGTGKIDDAVPPPDSNLRIEKFSEILYPIYLERYRGLPPHDKT